MLIPRFSTRMLLLITTVCGLGSYVVMLAVRGQSWAIAVSIAICGLALTFGMHAMVFSFAWTISALWCVVRGRQETASPFANQSLPPQIIPPQDDE